MNSKGMFFSSAALAALLVSGALAQNTTTTTTQTGVIGQRQENQQDRIANGVASGQLTAGETSNLEKQEAKFNREKRDMREDNGGKLTAADKVKLTRQQNRMSSEIYRDKHNGAVQHYGNNEVGQRKENQQDRIAQGIKSGQLTAGETAKLEGKEAKLNHETHEMREDNGGKLTPQEKAKVNRQQNRLSKQIYNKKHNGAHQ